MGPVLQCSVSEDCRDPKCVFHQLREHLNKTEIQNKKESRPCRFGLACTANNCRFLHPTEFKKDYGNTSGSSTVLPLPPPNKLFESRPSKKNYHQEKEEMALVNHQECINQLKERIEDLIASLEYDNSNEDKKKQATIDILEGQIWELKTNLNVYEKVKSRAYRLHSKNEFALSNQINREIYRMKSRLPVFSKRIDIEKYFNDTTRIVIIQGQTGSGKSTQIPQYVADHPRFTGKRIICTQPRKIAAVSLANRVALEYNGGVTPPANRGGEIGYHVGGDKHVRKNCRIEFVTEGVLLERIVNATGDIFQNVGCIIIDEAHERSVTCDILLGYFKKEDPRWKDITIIVTSATIDLALFSTFFNRAPCLEIEGRTFPVDIEYRPMKENDNIRNSVALCALQIHRTRGKQPGDILCFLPGQEDVLYAQATFETELSKWGGADKLLQAQALALYGRMEPDQQAKVFEKLPKNERKVVFSTDVAETSVTIDGVVFVVDSGVKKEVVFDPLRNVSSLKVTTISKSSAIQRAGRCGRTQPGVCYRLYSQEDFDKMEINTAPEIHRKPISLAVLTLREMKIDPGDFDWISAPSKEAMIAADEELRYLRALDEENQPTELGKLISSVQQEPKMVKMIYTGCKDGFGDAAVRIASIMSVANIVFWNGNDEETKSKAKTCRKEFSLPEGDIATLYRVFEKWMKVLDGNEENALEEQEAEMKRKRFDRKKEASKWCLENFVNGKAMNLAFSTRKDLLSQFKYSSIWKKNPQQDSLPTNSNICRLACSGYFLNSARLVLSKTSNVPNQYFALHSEVTGKLDNKGALLNSPNKPELPSQWIIYDKIFRPSVTIFPVTSVIDKSWIEEESPEFYHACLEKEMSLPTELLTKYISQECLRRILGKRFANVDILEQEMKCAISGDVETGRIELLCTHLNKSTVEKLIDDKIAAAVSELEKQVTEEDYLDGTRVVIGQGFEVKDVLFPQEYATLFIKNVPNSIHPEIVTSILTQENEQLGSLEVMEQGSYWNGIAKFCFKKDAKQALERISNVLIGNQKLVVQPKLGPRKQISQGLSSRLKLSWALELSSGVANIFFHTAEVANLCISYIPNIFPEARISRVHGDSVKSIQKCNADPNAGSNKNLFPPVLCIPTPRGSNFCRFQFDINSIELSPFRESFIYKITVVSLPLSLDEQDLNDILKSYNPKYINVTRGKDRLELSAKNFQLDPEEKKSKLAPLKKYLKTDTTIRDFLEPKVRRAGVFIFFNGNNGNLDAKEAFNKADVSSLGLHLGQRHRLEIDYTHSVSINQQLLIFLEAEFTEFKTQAREKGIFITEAPPKNNSKFTVIRFRTNRRSNILWIQEQLEKITSCTKFTDEQIALLFTWAGRQQMAVVAETGFVHWNNKNHGIWIYGSPELKEEISLSIKNIITSLSSMEVLDKVVELDKKKICNNANKISEVAQMCQKFGISFHHSFGSRLYLSGSENSVNNLESHLRLKGLTRPVYNNKRNEETRECGACFCVPDEAFIVTVLCGHVFCIGCIKPLFEIKPSPPLPIACPTCELPVALNDILKCAPVQSLRSILEVSIFAYQKEHSKEVRICPQPDCSQILSYHSRTTENQEGDFVFCNECVSTYCITCSEKLSKPIKSHEGSSCEDVQSGVSFVVRKYVREIQDTILNLQCPGCKQPFYEFDGCAAVTCSSCKCGFCGLCLENCGTDAHSHVLRCPKNPGGSYFVSNDALNEAHRSMRKQKVRDYISKIKNPTIRNKVCEAIAKDLDDLGVKNSFVKSLLVEDTSPVDDENQNVNQNENPGDNIRRMPNPPNDGNYNAVPPPNYFDPVQRFVNPRAEPRVVRNNFERPEAVREEFQNARQAEQQFLNELPLWLRQELEQERNEFPFQFPPQRDHQPFRPEPQRVPNRNIPPQARPRVVPNVNPPVVERRRREDRCRIL